MPEATILSAARRWREARDAGDPVQPALHAVLSDGGWDMLVPAFDSLMTLCEQCFDRALCTGCLLAPSADERLLCRLLADPSALGPMPPCRADRGLHHALDCALLSARIILTMAHPAPSPGSHAP